jgi:hypothetical protein
MVGWMILFALIAIPGVGAAIAGYHAALPLKTTSAIFSALLLICLITRLLRTRVR